MNAPSRERRILVVDDVPDNVGVLFDFLEAHGFKVLVLESARHALRELHEIAPELILLDVMMPELDGFETCRRIRADARFADVPVFFMTALGDPVDKVRGLQVGAADYITKPIFPEEVLARINVHLALRDARRALGDRNRELAERNNELTEQNEKLDAAIQQRMQAERALRESLDRAVFVADLRGRVQFIAAAAVKLLQRYYPASAAGQIPGEILVWLTQAQGGRFVTTRGAHQLELTCAPLASGAGESRLVYLDEKRPRPSPEMLHCLGLTPREAEILFWIAQGKTSPEIAIIVGSATGTVRKHVENITAKLGVESRLAAAVKAMEILGSPS